MTKKVKIIKLKEGNELAVSRLCRRCIQEINSKDMTEKQAQFLCSYFSPKSIRDSSKEANIYVAVLGDKIVGTGSLLENQIKAVFVNPSYHGLGIGAKLITHLEKILKRKGYNSVFLRSSKHAVEFYKKFGYKKIKKINSIEVGEMALMKKKIQ